VQALVSVISLAYKIAVAGQSIVLTGMFAYLRKMYEINSTAHVIISTKLSHFTQCQSFICHFSIEVSGQNMQIGRIKTIKTADSIIMIYQNTCMLSPAESLTFETSSGTKSSIVCEIRNPTMTNIFEGIVFH